MPNIKSMSSLRNYSDVLNEVDIGGPVFLTRNGKGKYAILDMDEYDSMRNALWGRLFEELDESMLSADRQGWVSLADARKQVMANG
jgi:prevent-host-death family protein